MKFLYWVIFLVAFYYIFIKSSCEEYEVMVPIDSITNKYSLAKANIKTLFEGVQVRDLTDFLNDDDFVIKICNRGEDSSKVDNLAISCAFDSYNPTLQKLSPKEKNILDYKKGLYGSSWYVNIKNFTIALYPVKSIKEAKWTNEGLSYISIHDGTKSDKISLLVNTYQGIKSTLVRGFATKNDYNIICYDAIFDRENPRKSKLTFYYTQDKYLFKKELNLIKAGL